MKWDHEVLLRKDPFWGNCSSSRGYYGGFLGPIFKKLCRMLSGMNWWWQQDLKLEMAYCEVVMIILCEITKNNVRIIDYHSSHEFSSIRSRVHSVILGIENYVGFSRGTWTRMVRIFTFKPLYRIFVWIWNNFSHLRVNYEDVDSRRRC